MPNIHKEMTAVGQQSLDHAVKSLIEYYSQSDSDTYL